MKNTGKLRKISPTNSGRGTPHANSGRGKEHVNKGAGIPHENSGRQTVHINLYRKNLDKYNWICKRVLQEGVACAISSALGKKGKAEQVHHVYPRLRAPQYIYDENFLIPLTYFHHAKVENEEEKLAWEQQEVIIAGIGHKLDLTQFRKIWKEFRLEYEAKYEKAEDNGEEEEDQAF
jgi:hypothetical protein